MEGRREVWRDGEWEGGRKLGSLGERDRRAEGERDSGWSAKGGKELSR